jgi:hypothetical protein
MIKNINEIKKEYIRFNNLPSGELVIEVCVIKWDGPCTPFSDWIVVKRFDKDRPRKEQMDCMFFDPFAVPVFELENEVSKILNNRKYFQICGRCRSLKPVGHMCDDYMCQSCGSKFEGIVY